MVRPPVERQQSLATLNGLIGFADPTSPSDAPVSDNRDGVLENRKVHDRKVVTGITLTVDGAAFDAKQLDGALHSHCSACGPLRPHCSCLQT